jgi:hypothetical protein
MYGQHSCCYCLSCHWLLLWYAVKFKHRHLTLLVVPRGGCSRDHLSDLHSHLYFIIHKCQSCDLAYESKTILYNNRCC